MSVAAGDICHRLPEFQRASDLRRQWTCVTCQQNRCALEFYWRMAMARLFGILATLIALATAAYIYSKNAQRFTGPSPGGSIVSAPLLTGVKKDLMAIASAERSYLVQQGKYGS